MFSSPLTSWLILSSILVVLTAGVFALVIRSFLRTLTIRKRGKHVLAIVTEINKEYILFTKGGYSTSFFVHADWEDPETGTVHHFKSDAGGMYLPINYPPGSSIDVLIDPHNPQQYEVQLRFEERSFV